MARNDSALTEIRPEGSMDSQTGYLFGCQLQDALLLALADRGILDTTQYRNARDDLSRQRTGRTKQLLQGGKEP